MKSFVGIASITLKVDCASILVGVQDTLNGLELTQHTTTAESSRSVMGNEQIKTMPVLRW